MAWVCHVQKVKCNRTKLLLSRNFHWTHNEKKWEKYLKMCAIFIFTSLKTSADFPCASSPFSHFARFASLQRHPDRVPRNWECISQRTSSQTLHGSYHCVRVKRPSYCKINEELIFRFLRFLATHFQFSDVELRTKRRKSTAYAICSVLDAGSELFFCENESFCSYRWCENDG